MQAKWLVLLKPRKKKFPTKFQKNISSHGYYHLDPISIIPERGSGSIRDVCPFRTPLRKKSNPPPTSLTIHSASLDSKITELWAFPLDLSMSRAFSGATIPPHVTDPTPTMAEQEDDDRDVSRVPLNDAFPRGQGDKKVTIIIIITMNKQPTAATTWSVASQTQCQWTEGFFSHSADDGGQEFVRRCWQHAAYIDWASLSIEGPPTPPPCPRHLLLRLRLFRCDPTFMLLWKRQMFWTKANQQHTRFVCLLFLFSPSILVLFPTHHLGFCIFPQVDSTRNESQETNRNSVYSWKNAPKLNFLWTDWSFTTLQTTLLPVNLWRIPYFNNVMNKKNQQSELLLLLPLL